MPAVTHRYEAMMQLCKFTMAALAALYLSACAATKPAAPFTDEFVTEITGNGTKFFTYIRQLPGNTGSTKGQSGDNLNKAVQARLDSSGYCRDGYLALERYHANGIARIRGECRDGATGSDREQFPNLH